MTDGGLKIAIFYQIRSVKAMCPHIDKGPGTPMDRLYKDNIRIMPNPGKSFNMPMVWLIYRHFAMENVVNSCAKIRNNMSYSS